MPADQYRGLLFIGDPHLAGRPPGFRRDDYPRTILKKLSWCFEYARQNRLLPAILGDLFHWPRDNANWLMAEVLSLLDTEVLAIYGNHDCATNALSDDDSLQVIFRARRLRLIEPERTWDGTIGSRRVIVGGTPWGRFLPDKFELNDDFMVADKRKPLVFWMAHHDIRFPGAESTGRFDAREIPGIDAIINGHIHMTLPDATLGGTVWINPGNIARVKVSDGVRTRAPAVLRVDIDAGGWRRELIEVPHERFADVFHAQAAKAAAAEAERSLFVSGLNELRTRRTEGGGGLLVFLKKNMDQYPQSVQAEILALAKEVIPDGKVET